MRVVAADRILCSGQKPFCSMSVALFFFSLGGGSRYEVIGILLKDME